MAKARALEHMVEFITTLADLRGVAGVFLFYLSLPFYCFKKVYRKYLEMFSDLYAYPREYRCHIGQKPLRCARIIEMKMSLVYSNVLHSLREERLVWVYLLVG